MNNTLISIVIPVFNVELYLSRCINSVLGQTYSKLEVILVDDGSTDKSGALCDDFAKKDSRITVIHKKNGGLSSARNAGVNASSGQMITFVDSDDWIEKDTYQYCLTLLEQNEADCAQYNYIMVTNTNPVKQPKEKISTYLGKEILQFYMESTTRTGSYSVCRCLFPKEALLGISFREGKINEDIDYKYKAFCYCRKLVVSNQIKYFYFQSGNSLSTGGLKKKDFDLYEAANELEKLTKNETYGSICFLGKVKKARTAFSLLSRIAYYGINDHSIDEKLLIKQLIRENRRYSKTLLRAPISIVRKLFVILFCISYPMTKACIRLMKRMSRN